MDGVDRERRRSFKERLGFRVMGCCRSNWGFRSTTISLRDEDEVEDDIEEPEQEPVPNPDPGCVNPAPFSSGMNLAAALAAERHFRASHEPQRTPTSNVGYRLTGKPPRVLLMRLLEEADGGDAEEDEKGRSMEMGNDSMCCVCMGRKKGAAFIPCGHTFCRVCSRELWLNRGSCPLCNRSILEILDIF
ncbi:hypothetical protein F3Y22_tig00110933pilonHSYRG00293 [Hibiscus syriacus]|uniref:RING-type domain-containing protein n=1 Tax=Hibiscus syriacus TaxID=106335 RepID=A0A6A2ZFH5_HIBSY|nr:uncharacterized protein LOC120147040 [Hibiscus syriacus]KAE8689685.1 hypothetical protein F3Y22_tig00110933pilonHSYRG00293 [Hibiscus syriacus]